MARTINDSRKPPNPQQSDEDSDSRDNEDLFCDEDGKPIGFYIQREDVEEELRRELARKIKEHGGIVKLKVPLKGYVLFQSETPEGKKLDLKFNTGNRPKRQFKPLSFVDASIRLRRLADQHEGNIFVFEGKPLRVYVHASVETPSMDELIEENGGTITDSPNEAQVMLADKSAVAELEAEFPSVAVQTPAWAEDCIDNLALAYEPRSVSKKKGKSVVREESTKPSQPFTMYDVYNLAKYLEETVPSLNPTERGDAQVYEDLVANPDDYPWSTAHTADEWRLHYLKKRARYETIIVAGLRKSGVILTPVKEALPTETPAKAGTKRKNLSSGNGLGGEESPTKRTRLQSPVTPDAEREMEKARPEPLEFKVTGLDFDHPIDDDTLPTLPIGDDTLPMLPTGDDTLPTLPIETNATPVRENLPHIDLTNSPLRKTPRSGKRHKKQHDQAVEQSMDEDDMAIDQILQADVTTQTVDPNASVESSVPVEDIVASINVKSEEVANLLRTIQNTAGDIIPNVPPEGPKEPGTPEYEEAVQQLAEKYDISIETVRKEVEEWHGYFEGADRMLALLQEKNRRHVAAELAEKYRLKSSGQEATRVTSRHTTGRPSVSTDHSTGDTSHPKSPVVTVSTRRLRSAVAQEEQVQTRAKRSTRSQNGR